MPKNKPRTSTTDQLIRKALTKRLASYYANYENLKIIQELGLQHGTVRIDIAVVNGIMHGYEIKSDRDTLHRLPVQMEEYNAVFDQVTLVVGKKHLYEAIKMVPDWWGLIMAKVDDQESIIFQIIREAKNNPAQKDISIARLLWRSEALKILEDQNKAMGYRSKPRELVYKRLIEVLDINSLKENVRRTLQLTRAGWRSDVPLVLSGD